jgi:hypothetical protein
MLVRSVAKRIRRHAPKRVGIEGFPTVDAIGRSRRGSLTLERKFFSVIDRRRSRGIEAGLEKGMGEAWRRCSACKEPIALGALYYTCSVSTCNRKRTALAFCSVSCWEVHLPTERHREAWAIEQQAPMRAEPIREAVARSARTASETGRADRGEILIVASKLKAYIRTRSDYNTSDGALSVLSDAIRRICDEAIANARRAERGTVMERDVPRE